jgi:hypothetical protein
MDVICEEHMIAFHKRLSICDPSLGLKFLQEVQIHYNMNPKPEMLTEKLQMFVLACVQTINFFGSGSGINLEFLRKFKNFQSKDFHMPLLINGFTKIHILAPDLILN